MFGREWPNDMTFGLAIAIILGLWAVLSIVQNQTNGTFSKAIWVFLVLFVPFFGFVLWLFFGPKAPKKS